LVICFWHPPRRRWTLFRQNVGLQKRCGVPVEVVDPDEIRRLVPFVQLDGILGGTFCATDGYAAPYEVTMAMPPRPGAAASGFMSNGR